MFPEEKMLNIVISRSSLKKLGSSSVMFHFLFFEAIYKDTSCV